MSFSIVLETVEQATAASNQTVSPPAATANASSLTPTPQLSISPSTGSASVSAPLPTVTNNATVNAPVGSASASSLVSTPQIRVSPAAATASASAPTPQVTSGQTISPPAATASASALVPVPQLRLAPAAATASTSALVPVPQLNVSPAAASASANSQIPIVPAIQPPRAAANASSPTMTGRKGMRLDATLSASAMRALLDTLKADGVEHVRASAAWPTLNPSNGTFVWTTTDNVVNEATARGMTVSLTVDGMPGWVNPNGFWVPPRSAGELSSWQTFAQTMAARYAGLGLIYECWNEPDQGSFWLDPTGTTGAPNPTEYAPVLKAFYTGIKAGDANGQVAGMVVNRTRLGYIGAVYDALESQFTIATCRANNYFFDLLALHPYCLTHAPDFASADDTTDTWGVVCRRFLDFRRGYDLVYQREGVRKNLIFGEFGYSTTSGSNGPITDATRATYVPLAYSGVRAGNYVHSLTWFTYAHASASDFDIQGTTSETAYAAVAQSLPPVILSVPPASATASSSALVPTVTAGAANQTVNAPTATASASALIPVPQLRLDPAAATANASAPTPIPKVGATVPLATASANGPPPLPQLAVTPTSASASASGLIPLIFVPQRVSPPAATSSASSPTPIVTSHPLAEPSATRRTRSSGNRGTTRSIGVSGKTILAKHRQVSTRICTLGYSNQVLGGVDPLVVQTQIGRAFTGLRQNQAYTTTGWATAITEYDAGRVVTYRSIQFDTFPGGWAAVATGGADATITTTFNALRAANRWNAQNPALICFHHECTLSPFGTTGFLAADYKAMWQHLTPFCDSNGWTVHRSDGSYNPNGVMDLALVGWDRMFVGANGIGPPTAGQGIDDVDPGPQYYQYLGNDFYNAIDSPGVLRYGTGALTLLNPVAAACASRNKDMIIGEMGCEDGATTQDHVNKAAWLDSLRLGLIARGRYKPGVCRALLLTIKASAENYNVDSSAESLAAYQRLGASTYFK